MRGWSAATNTAAPIAIEPRAAASVRWFGVTPEETRPRTIGRSTFWNAGLRS